MERFGLPPGTEGYVEQRLTEILQLSWNDRQPIQAAFALLSMPPDEQASIETSLQDTKRIRAETNNKVDDVMNKMLCRVLKSAPPGWHVPETAQPSRGPSGPSK